MFNVEIKFLLCLTAVWFFDFVSSLQIEVPQCDPPDIPNHGKYGPIKDEYLAGDIIHYYCDTETYIGGNYLRKCEDSGDWSGDTPVCDTPSKFAFVNQTSTAEPRHANDAVKALDSFRGTCSSTAGGSRNEYWMGKLEAPGEMIRVMLFLPKGPVSYEVVLVKESGYELSCGKRTAYQDRLDWTFHNCPGPNNRDAAYLKIKSLSSNPLRICEMMVHVLQTPTCVDPHLQVPDGRIILDRKIAFLVCDEGFTRGRRSRIDCIRDGVWSSARNLHCTQNRDWEPNARERHPPAGNPERHDP